MNLGVDRGGCLRLGTILTICGAFLIAGAGAQSAVLPVKVGIFERPPFAMKDMDGHWSGFAVDIWEEIAAQCQWEYIYRELTPETVAGALERKEVDLVVGELAVTAASERVVDFSQPYISFPLAAAIPKPIASPNWLTFIKDLPQHGLIPVLSAIFGALILFSIMLWLVERGKNDAHFGGRAVSGFGSALWFAAVTMTTVGYGDKTPRTFLGRAISLVWMFFGILLISAFTATVASSVAVSRMRSAITTVSDLGRLRTGTIKGSAAERLLIDSGIRAVQFDSLQQGARALQSKTIQAFVLDEATLQYVVSLKGGDEFSVVPFQRARLYFAFPLPSESLLRKPLNIALIEVANSPLWSARIHAWLSPGATGGE